MNRKPIIAALFAAGALAASSAFAADATAKQVYKSAKDRIDAEYKVEIQRCDSLSGNAKDICKAEVKGRQKAAKADAYAAFKGTDKVGTSNYEAERAALWKCRKRAFGAVGNLTNHERHFPPRCAAEERDVSPIERP